MSAIDRYAHRCLGIIACPSRYPIMSGNDAQRLVPIYRLDQDVDVQERSFQGKRGDVLIGGGSGESAALRISMPDAFYFYTHEDWERFSGSGTWTPTTIATAYWSMTQAYVFGDGYHAVGWTPTKRIEVWLTEHTLSFLAQHYPSDYAHDIGAEPLGEDGSICRLPTADEARL
jgi:hypothetical protein